MKMPLVIKPERVPTVIGDNPIVEWEVTMKCNYACSYCTNLDKSLYPVMDEGRLTDFIGELGRVYAGAEVFLFGGEPFVHPKIGYIIGEFNRLSVPFVIQTNFSTFSVGRMELMAGMDWDINISIHPSEVSIDDVVLAFNRFREIFGGWDRIRIIDVMAVAGAVDYYLALKRLLGGFTELYLTPVTDFGDGESGVALARYNAMKANPIYRDIIQFEDVERFGRQRSELWADVEFTTRGKPCLYRGQYFLYGADLALNTCCYRGLAGDVCTRDRCFLM